MRIVKADLDCLFADDSLANNWPNNSDQFLYVPGRYFQCAVKWRFHLGNGEPGELRAYAGENGPVPGEIFNYGPTQYGPERQGTCYTKNWAIQKSTAETWVQHMMADATTTTNNNKTASDKQQAKKLHAQREASIRVRCQPKP
jgi:hypothetical protein